MDEMLRKMQKTVDLTLSKFASFRTGRANPELLARIQVEYYGSLVPINQVATVSVPENSILMLKIFDKSVVKDVEKAIQTSDLGLNPQVDGAVIYLRLPELTEERRKELTKLVKKQGEEGKVSIRNIRRDFLDQIKEQEKHADISEDEYKKISDNIQKETDKYIHKIEELIKNKEEEIMAI
jgi:ribosome recycling factor